MTLLDDYGNPIYKGYIFFNICSLIRIIIIKFPNFSQISKCPDKFYGEMPRVIFWLMRGLGEITSTTIWRAEAESSFGETWREESAANTEGDLQVFNVRPGGITW